MAAKPSREMKVLALGAMRTGTASMAEALEVLGYDGVYHGVKAIDSPEDWKILHRAADATFPSLPTYTGQSFTRAQWDELYGSYEATTDVASIFAMELIKAYPTAKVILVERDFDKWFHSVDEAVLGQLWGPVTTFSLNFIEPILGSEAGMASRKMILGWFSAQTPDEARRNARATYNSHYARIRAAVPKEQLLEYRLGDGWEPLCNFLDRPVPTSEFPWVNETEALQRTIKNKVKRDLLAAGAKLVPWVGALAAVGVGALFMYGYS